MKYLIYNYINCNFRFIKLDYGRIGRVFKSTLKCVYFKHMKSDGDETS